MRTPGNFNPKQQSYRPTADQLGISVLNTTVPHCNLMRQIGIAADESWLSQSSKELYTDATLQQIEGDVRDGKFAEAIQSQIDDERDRAFDYTTSYEQLSDDLEELRQDEAEVAAGFEANRAKRAGHVEQRQQAAAKKADLRAAYDRMVEKGGCEGPQAVPDIAILKRIGCSVLVCPFADDEVVSRAKEILAERDKTLPGRSATIAQSRGRMISCTLFS